MLLSYLDIVHEHQWSMCLSWDFIFATVTKSKTNIVENIKAKSCSGRYHIIILSLLYTTLCIILIAHCTLYILNKIDECKNINWELKSPFAGHPDANRGNVGFRWEPFFYSGFALSRGWHEGQYTSCHCPNHHHPFYVDYIYDDIVDGKNSRRVNIYCAIWRPAILQNALRPNPSSTLSSLFFSSSLSLR